MKAVGSLVMTALAAQTAADHLTVGDAKWTAPTSMDKYVKLLHKDTDAFVADVAAWVSRIADDKIETDASFAVRTDGREWSESCGDLSAHKAFHVLESFVDAPASAASSLKQATPLEWRPEDDCVAQRDFESLDGGSHAEFSVHCGKERLVHAISGGSGFYAPRGRHGDKYVGGAKAAVVVGDDIELSGVLYAGKRFKGKMETFHVPKHADKVVDDLHKAIRRCARDGDLVVSGVVGGGWTQRYTNKKGKHVKSVVGYANSFSLTPKANEKHGHKKHKDDDDDDDDDDDKKEKKSKGKKHKHKDDDDEDKDGDKKEKKPKTKKQKDDDDNDEDKDSDKKEKKTKSKGKGKDDDDDDEDKDGDKKEKKTKSRGKGKDDDDDDEDKDGDKKGKKPKDKKHKDDDDDDEDKDGDKKEKKTKSKGKEEESKHSKEGKETSKPKTKGKEEEEKPKEGKTKGKEVKPKSKGKEVKPKSKGKEEEEEEEPKEGKTKGKEVKPKSKGKEEEEEEKPKEGKTKGKGKGEEEKPKASKEGEEVAEPKSTKEAKPTKEVKPTEVVETTKAPHVPSKGVSVDKSVLVAANATSSTPSNATHIVLPSNATAPVATTLAVVNTTSAINTTTLTNASSDGSADGFAAITASLSDLSAHISLAYYEAGLECATRESDSVCQSARVAAKLNTKLVSLNAYETLDMSAVYGNRLTTSWGPSSFDAMAVAAVGAVCVTAFVALRTQQRRAGYMGIPQQDAAAAPTSTWPSYV